MDIDQIKEKWAQQDAAIRINRKLLDRVQRNQARSAVKRVSLLTAVHAAAWAAVVAWLGSVIYDHHSVPAMAADVYAIGMLGALICQMAVAGNVDFTKPVAEIQRRLELLRILRIRTTQWAVLAGVVVWVPFALVVFQPVVEVTWIAANVAFGIALIPLTLWASKKFGDRLNRSPFVQQILRDLAGNNLNAAKAFLADLAEFEA